MINPRWHELSRTNFYGAKDVRSFKYDYSPWTWLRDGDDNNAW